MPRGEKGNTDRIKISSGISLLFKSKGTNQRGSANYPAMSRPGRLSFSEVTKFNGRKRERVCLCVCWLSEREPNQEMSLKGQRCGKVLIFNISGAPEYGPPFPLLPPPSLSPQAHPIKTPCPFRPHFYQSFSPIPSLLETQPMAKNKIWKQEKAQMQGQGKKSKWKEQESLTAKIWIRTSWGALRLMKEKASG